MRESHVKQAHQNDPPQVSDDVQDLTQDGVEALLSDLVQKNRVGDVRKVLSNFPNALLANESRHKLQLLAAFAASGDMLKLLEKPVENDGAKQLSEALADCIAESIKGHNGSTLRYFLSQVKPYFLNYNISTEDSRGRLRLMHQLVSNDWLEGMEIWAKWLRSGVNIAPRDSMLRMLFVGKQTMQAVGSHLAGEQQLLYLWRDSRLTSVLDKTWLSEALRNVAEFSCSITLAAYLLEHGADINGRRARRQKTALHHAAGNTSAEGAELIRFLLLEGANPEINQVYRGRVTRARDEQGAKDIHQWLGKTWDELLEETNRIRKDKQARKEVMSKIGEGNENTLSEWSTAN